MRAGSRWIVLGTVLAWITAISAGYRDASAAERNTGLWNLQELRKTPTAQWQEPKGLVREVYYEGQPYQGKPTRVFGYYAKPAGDGPFPAMLLLHGGGGKAFPEWAKLWAERGYVALAMDLAGHGPDGKRLPDGGPDQDDKSKFGDFDDAGVKERWTYHAVGAAIQGHSLLAAQKEVDAERIGITGISWGGYLTCIVAGVDERLKVAVPVYGCGFIHENSCWVDGYFNKMSRELRERWVKQFDPSSYLAGVSCPILFVNGTNDFAYPLDSYQKSYELVDKKLVNLCVTVNMPHGHPQGWAPQEIGIFVDSVLKQGEPLAKLSAPIVTMPAIRVGVTTQEPLQSAQIHYSIDGGPWQKRTWKSADARIEKDAIVNIAQDIDRDKAVFFFTARDRRGAVVSSPHYDFSNR